MAYSINNNNQVPNGGYSLGNVSLTSGAGLTYTTATGAGTWGPTNITANPWYTKTPKVEITDKDLVIDGLSLRDFMQSVQDRLAILTPNPKLERDFDQLRELREQYQTLEKELLEKSKTWDTLKSTDR